MVKMNYEWKCVREPFVVSGEILKNKIYYDIKDTEIGALGRFQFVEFMKTW